MRVPEDLQIAAERGDGLLASQAQLGHRQAADSTDDTARLLLLLRHPALQTQRQVIARM